MIIGRLNMYQWTFIDNKLIFITILLYLFMCGVSNAGATPEEISTLKAKATAAQQQLKIAVDNNRDVSKVIPKMQQVKTLADKGKIRSADQLLNEILLDFKDINATDSGNGNPTPAITNYAELIIIGEDALNGSYDPSLEYGHDGIGWMSYSAVAMGNINGVQTRIARSNNQGANWTRVANVNNATNETVTFPDGEIVNGKWWHEVSTLVYDPNDPGKEWKLYWHRYLSRMPHRNEQDRLFAYGWIAYSHASSPLGPWSKEIALIGAGPFPLAPFTTKFKIGDLDSSLQKYIVLTEPGSLQHNGRLYLSLQAVRDPELGTNKHDIIMIASNDHGETWEHVAVVLTAEDAKSFDADWFTGSSLVVEDDRVFLMVCPEIANNVAGHRGTVIFEFEDITRGAIKRSFGGKPKVIKQLAPRLSMGGQSDYDAQNINGGIVMPQFDLRNLPKAFRIFNTKKTITEK
jgi:hypothetical protein